MRRAVIVKRLHAACYVQALPNRAPTNHTGNALQAVGCFALQAVVGFPAFKSWLDAPVCNSTFPLTSFLMLFYFQMDFHG